MATKLGMHLEIVVEDFVSESGHNIMSRRVHILKCSVTPPTAAQDLSRS